MFELNKTYNVEAIEFMSQLPDNSVDMILCDLPYGTTRNKWDCEISLPNLWEQYERITRDSGAIVLTAQTPFDKVLGASNLRLLKYEWIWEKEAGTGHLNSNFAPLKSHENILVFSKLSASFVKDKSKAMKYNPQMEIGKPYTTTKGSLSTNYDTKWDKIVTTENSGERYPKTVLRYARDREKLHPTQKPVALFEYLIKTYTNESDIVLDNCMGSGTTAVACKNTGRNFFGCELDEKYCEIANKRLEQVQGSLF